MSDASAPRFPPPPLAPIRTRGQPRTTPEPVPLPMIRPREGPLHSRHIIPVSRFSVDSDRSSFSDASTFSQRGTPVIGLGLRPAPQRRNTNTFRASMAPIPGSPTDETDNGDSLSPIMSGAPPAPSYPPKLKVSTPYSPVDDSIPDEHKRVPGLIPRSPLSPVAASLASMARRAVRRPVPPPIVVQPLPKSKFNKDFESPVSAQSVVIGIETLPVPAQEEKPKPKRKTVWGFNVEGWWDLGLLERMNTVRRKGTVKK